MIGSHRARCWPMSGHAKHHRVDCLDGASARPEAECKQGRPLCELFLFCHRASRPQNMAKLNDSFVLSQRAFAADLVRCLFGLRFRVVSCQMFCPPL
jgi:hypothetical protein